MTGAIILAAGASTRLGSPKQLVTLNGETLLDRAVRTAHEASCLPVVVILGASSSLIYKNCDLEKTTVLINDHWTEGMASSLRMGIETLSQENIDGTIILTCDMPAITATHLRSLQVSGRTTASRYAGRNGIPAFFPCGTFQDLLLLQGDMGARELLRKAAHIDLVNGQLDIDTPEDVTQMLSEATTVSHITVAN